MPNLVAYDPAFAYELAVILRDGIRRMYEDVKEDIFYYITLYNDNYPMLAMPEGPLMAFSRVFTSYVPHL